jgi:hypothetical protein
VTLTDASALIGLVNKKDKQHARCHQATRLLSKPLVTTWSCFTEAMHLAYSIGQWNAQRALWKLARTGAVRLLDPQDGDPERIFLLMEKYRDTPMDLADASLVVAAETLGLTRIFTLDSVQGLSYQRQEPI